MTVAEVKTLEAVALALDRRAFSEEGTPGQRRAATESAAAFIQALDVAGVVRTGNDIPSVGFKRLPHAGDLPLPRYETAGAAGMDVRSAITLPVILRPGDRLLIPTGFAIEVTEGYEAQVRPRSGLAAKQGVTVLNSPGTIDCDYRGEVFALLVNISGSAVTIDPGERIAQLVIARAMQAHIYERHELSDTVRGESGFGSTGK